MRERFGLPRDRFVALFVGRDVPKKGLDVFLGADDPAYDLVAVTDRKPMPEAARIVPFVEPERFRELLASVDAFVLPSQGEGFPLALQEALVSGIPCVVSREPGYEHYVREEEVVFVVRESASIRDALRRLADDEPRRLALGARARAAGVREFALERFVGAYEEVYADAVQAAQPMPVTP